MQKRVLNLTVQVIISSLGLGEVLGILAQQPFSPVILGIVPLGLIAYGIYSVIQARYRRIFRS